MWKRLTTAVDDGVPAITHGGVVAQVWRGGQGRQALLARSLKSVAVHPLDERLGREAGRLLATSGTTDAVDAAVVALTHPGDKILTSDPGDIDRLVEAAGVDAQVVPV